ncbi:MAG: hypothetical protein IJ809_04050 [Clostridia bacterium]|nr:hypothetical protein [Clostridia bacterium]
MYKKILGIIVVVLLAIFIVILSVNLLKSPKMYVAENQEYNIDKDISFTVTKANNMFVTFEIVNNKSESITYDSVYEIEKNIDGIWLKYELEVEFVQADYTIEPGKKAVENVVLGNVYNLGNGRYRLLKQIDSKMLCAEFEIAT